MANLTKTVDRNKVNEAEAIMAKMPQINLFVKHHFSKDVYARELHIPKGVTLTGKIHKFENLNILIKGKIKVLIDNTIQIVEAPFIVVSPAGTKRIAYALEDCIWITIHGTAEKNVDEIEKQFIAENEKDYLQFINSHQLYLPGILNDKIL